MKAVSEAVRFIKKSDKLLFVLVTGLSLFSVVLLWSLAVNEQTQNITNIKASPSLYKNQLIAVAIGVTAAVVISFFDYEKLAKLWFLYAPFALVLTFLTFSPLGKNGLQGADDKAWIDLGVISIQPSEILKIAFILSFSYHCFKSRENFNKPLNILLLCLHAAVPIATVALQGDDGTAAVFAVIFAAIIFAAGLSWKYIVSAMVAAPVAGALLWFFYLQPTHKNRILAMLNPSMASEDILYQQRLSKIALGSGQLYGKGLLGGDYCYVPVCHNDFIFSYIGQTLGFIGCMAVAGVLCVICAKILYNGIFARDKLGQLICVGVFALLLTHCVLNIGMVIGVTPVIGIPLPFVSAGGTAMMSMNVCVGLVYSVYVHSAKSDKIFVK